MDLFARTITVEVCQNCEHLRGEGGDCPNDRDGIHIYGGAIKVNVSSVPLTHAGAVPGVTP